MGTLSIESAEKRVESCKAAVEKRKKDLAHAKENLAQLKTMSSYAEYKKHNYTVYKGKRYSGAELGVIHAKEDLERAKRDLEDAKKDLAKAKAKNK